MSRAVKVTALFVGCAFGFFLTGSGLGDYQTIHRGLLLESDYIYLMMAASVGVGAVGIALLRRRGRSVFGGDLELPRHRVQRSTLMGAGLFGVAFGVGATCPGITVAMLATGGMYGAVVLGGILVGLWLRGRVEEAESARAPSPEARRPAAVAAVAAPPGR